MGKDSSLDAEFDASPRSRARRLVVETRKKIAGVLAVEGDARTARLETWCVEARGELARTKMSELAGGILPAAVFAFVRTALELLERKFDGKDIASDVRRLTKNGADFDVVDCGRYIEISEGPDTFWAVEYDFLFIRLDRTLGGGWLNAVTRCDDDQCGVFFIKARADQRHHTAACRTRSANRKAYALAAGPSQSNRGRPRLTGRP